MSHTASIERIDGLVERIDALLPQTQCAKCGYAGCRPYAEALARGDAEINRCPPGSEATMIRLAALLGREPKPLDPACGAMGPRKVARIDEARCIGCALCLEACPVDAIVGASKLMHTVIADQCTGCELCLPPCPVDCIELLPVREPWGAAEARAAKSRFESRNARLARQAAARHARRAAGVPAERERRKAVLAAAIARSKARKSARRA